MTEFTPQIDLRIENFTRIPTANVPSTHESASLAPTYHVRFADFVKDQNITVTRGATVAETNQNLYEKAQEIAAELGDVDHLNLSAEPPKDWRILRNGGWEQRGRSGIAIRLDSGNAFRFAMDRTDCEYWLGLCDPES